MIIGIKDFSGCETLKERVSNDDARKLRYFAGWNSTTGQALPDKLPTVISTTTLDGTMPIQSPIAFRDKTGVRVICRDADEKMRVMTAAGVWSAAGDTVQVIGNNVPFKLGPYVVFAEDGVSARLTAFEPDSATTKTRPLSLKSPRNYDVDVKPVATPSADLRVQLFDLADPTPCWAANGGGAGFWEVKNKYVDFVKLRFYVGATANTLCFKYDLGAAGIDFTSKVYINLDMCFKWVGTDPAKSMLISGEMINSDQTALSSGLEFVLYSDQACTAEIRRYIIPAMTTTGVWNRIMWHIGTITPLTVKGLGIRTAANFVAPSGVSDYYELWFASEVAEAGWYQQGNFLLPATVYDESPWIDELPPDSGTEGTSAVNLETFAWHPDSYDDFSPDHPRIVYRYCFRGRDALSTDYYHVMISNPSEDSSEVFADPWRTYEVEVLVPPSGPSTIDWKTVTLIATGTDLITCPAHGFEANFPVVFSRVASNIVPGTTYYVVAGYSDDQFQISDTSGGGVKDLTGPTVTTNLPKVIRLSGLINNVTDEYDDYVDYFLIYRSIYTGLGEDEETGELGIWYEYEFIAAEEIPPVVLEVNYTDDADDSDPEVDDKDVPVYMEANHDYADSALHAIVADTRVYAGHLTYNSAVLEWKRPLQLQVSNFEDFSSFPTIPSDDHLETDGEELGEFAPDSYEIRGMLVKSDVKFIFTDTGFWELMGISAAMSWRFFRRDAIGCVSAKTIADCRNQIIWHSGMHFYSYAGELAVPISDETIDSSLIDFAYAHGAVFAADRYIFFCKYADPVQTTPWCLMIYNLKTGSWQRCHSTAYELAGICVADSSGIVYGLTHDGDVVNIFGGTVNYGDADAEGRYVIDTQYIELDLPPGVEVHSRHVILEAITNQTSIDLEIDVYSQGRLNASATGGVLSIGKTRTKYGEGDFDVDLLGSAFRIVLTYSGTTPPDIQGLFLCLDDIPAEV